MGTRTQYGYFIPDDSDKQWGPNQLEENWERASGHTHNGVDSAPLDLHFSNSGFEVVYPMTQSGNVTYKWAADTDGFSVTLTVPQRVDAEHVSIACFTARTVVRNNVNTLVPDEQILPFVDILSQTQVKLKVNDPRRLIIVRYR